MSGGGGNQQDLLSMKKLLNAWNVEILYEFFKEEDISIEELKMMQCSHINNLLKNYKMGIRIRFEHHFTNWRTKIGIPLKAQEELHNTYCCHYKPKTSDNLFEYQNLPNVNTIPNTNSKMKTGKRRKTSHSEETMKQKQLVVAQPPASPESVKSEVSWNPEVAAAECNNEDITSPTLLPNDNTAEEADNLSLNALADLLSSSTTETRPIFPSKQTPEKCPIKLAQILQLSGSRGISIVKFYQKQKRLTNIHRTQLIQTIVEFFEENDYHLSLNVSHNLEWEILQMFPTEKLEYYRTEKRGKIYVKHCNMKRYKRERSNKVNSELESVSLRSRRLRQTNDTSNQLDGLVIEDNYDDWDMIPEPLIEVKEENLSE